MRDNILGTRKTGDHKFRVLTKLLLLEEMDTQVKHINLKSQHSTYV